MMKTILIAFIVTRCRLQLAYCRHSFHRTQWPDIIKL